MTTRYCRNESSLNCDVKSNKYTLTLKVHKPAITDLSVTRIAYINLRLYTRAGVFFNALLNKLTSYIRDK